MKRQYRVTFNQLSDPNMVEILLRHNINHKSTRLPGSNPANRIFFFDIHDKHPAWPEISSQIKARRLPALPKLIFTKREILQAEWCHLSLINPTGYPQPEDDWLQGHYAYDNYHFESGTFDAQTSSISIAKEPPEASRAFMTLFWTSALLARQDVVAALLSAGITGFERHEVNVVQTRKESSRICQLQVTRITDVGMKIPAGHPSVAYDNGVVKYLPITEDVFAFPPTILEEKGDFLLTREWFGDGHAAYRPILVSRRVAELVVANKWTGAALQPVRIVGDGEV